MPAGLAGGRHPHAMDATQVVPAPGVVQPWLAKPPRMGNQDCVEMAVALAATDIPDVCVHGVMESDRKGVEIEAEQG